MSTGDTPVEEARRELRRCLDRIAALGPGRLVRPGPGASEGGAAAPGTSAVAGPVGAEAVGSGAAARPVDVVRPVLQHLADASADLEGEPRRAVPELGAHALGDQLAVLAGDVLAAADARGGDAAVVDLHDRLVALRRAL